MKVITVMSVKAVQGSVGSKGDTLRKFECETSEGTLLLHFEHDAALALKELIISAPATIMQSGGPAKRLP